MQRSSSKLGQLCHSVSSLRSLQRHAFTTRSPDSLPSHGVGPSSNDELSEFLHEFVGETTQSRVQDKKVYLAKKKAMGVLDRAANWAHVKPMRKRRAPPLGAPQLSMEKILRAPQDIFDDEIFDTELGDQALSKGSFLEIRRSVYDGPHLFSFIHDPESAGTTG